MKLNNETAEKVTDFFRHYKKGTFIYPGVLRRKFHLSMEMIYDILGDMEREGIIKCYYEMYCSKCQKSMGTVKTFNELPEYFQCELCDEELLTLENCYLIYKVIKDE